MKKTIAILLLFALAIGCKEKPKEEPVIIQEDEELLELVNTLSGSFSNKQQATADTTYHHVNLHLVPIWQSIDNYWMYVEQALQESPEEPYRQRIYRLSRENDTLLKSEVFEIPNESLWANKWKTPEAFDKLLEESLEKMEGCTVFLQRNAPKKFTGKTKGNNCKNALRGAVYATSEVNIAANSITSWDKGFDEKDNQVWGAKKGGYIFYRTAQAPGKE